MAFRKEYILGARRDDVIGTVMHDIRRLPRTRRYKLTLEPLSEPVTDAQRGLWFIWMDILAKDIGYRTGAEIYEEVLKGMVLGGVGISKLDKDRMTDLMNWAQRFFAEWGYILPSSHDEYYQGLEQEQAVRGRRLRLG